MIFVLLTSAMALGTAVFGWVAVPVLAFAYGVWQGPRKSGALAGGGALLGWIVLMVWNWTQGPLADLLSALGEIMGLPSGVLLLATALFPTLLAWSAAVVGGALSRQLDLFENPAQHNAS
jgi:hypothetical protein